jgi:hypothetical protein
MICPGTQNDCDNPGCRHGGCQGRLPQLPLFQAVRPLDSVMPVAETTPAHADVSAENIERLAA